MRALVPAPCILAPLCMVYEDVGLACFVYLCPPAKVRERSAQSCCVLVDDAMHSGAPPLISYLHAYS